MKSLERIVQEHKKTGGKNRNTITPKIKKHNISPKEALRALKESIEGWDRYSLEDRQRMLEAFMEIGDYRLKFKPENGKPKPFLWNPKTDEWIPIKEIPYIDLYRWACLLTTEQSEERYFPNEEVEALLRRLVYTKGNLIAIIGLQGSGKTALRQYLYKKIHELLSHDESIYAFKWFSEKQIEKEISLAENYYFEDTLLYSDEYIERIMDEFIDRVFGTGRYHIADVPPIVYNALKAYGLRKDEAFLFKLCFEDHREEFIKKCHRIVPMIEKFLGARRINEIKKEIILEKIQLAHTILMDFPDYDKRSRSRMIRDLAAFQSWWENVLEKYEGYEQSFNLVVFWQKELWGGHFSFGKFDVIELKPWPPEKLAEVIDKNWEHPFTKEALIELGVLSRGIWRRFKKYIRICLDHYYAMKEKKMIDRKQIKEWITLDQLVKDMELELMDIYPNNKELRKKCVIVLRYLREKGPTDQPTITRDLFDGNKMAASRLLNKLEAHGYIEGHYEGREKIWNIT
ncbi:hypothetical protein J7L06_01910 [Candidatus Bathyarchaeota archaeon]|nr:hypothetical protein [Candidatus Bathyarchaeota archaeon]